MSHPTKAAHTLGAQYPELMTDVVSSYVSNLKEKLGAANSSAVYSVACRSAPLPENPLALKRGSVVEIKGEKFITLGSGFMTLEFASLDRPGQLLTLGPSDYSHLDEKAFRVLEEDESEALLNSLLA